MKSDRPRYEPRTNWVSRKQPSGKLQLVHEESACRSQFMHASPYALTSTWLRQRDAYNDVTHASTRLVPIYVTSPDASRGDSILISVSFIFAVLRDVVRSQRGDAQTGKTHSVYIYIYIYIYILFVPSLNDDPSTARSGRAGFNPKLKAERGESSDYGMFDLPPLAPEDLSYRTNM